MKTLLVPTQCDDGVVIDFWREGEHYVFDATPNTLGKSLRLIEYCANNPELNLTTEDAGDISSAMMKLMPLPLDSQVLPPVVKLLAWVLAVGSVLIVFG